MSTFNKIQHQRYLHWREYETVNVSCDNYQLWLERQEKRRRAGLHILTDRASHSFEITFSTGTHHASLDLDREDVLEIFEQMASYLEYTKNESLRDGV